MFPSFQTSPLALQSLVSPELGCWLLGFFPPNFRCSLGVDTQLSSVSESESADWCPAAGRFRLNLRRRPGLSSCWNLLADVGGGAKSNSELLFNKG